MDRGMDRGMDGLGAWAFGLAGARSCVPRARGEGEGLARTRLDERGEAARVDGGLAAILRK
eukprot:459219-Prymnesium_polylepis.1